MLVDSSSLIPEHSSLVYTIDRKTSSCAIKLTTKHQGYFVMRRGRMQNMQLMIRMDPCGA